VKIFGLLSNSNVGIFFGSSVRCSIQKVVINSTMGNNNLIYGSFVGGLSGIMNNGNINSTTISSTKIMGESKIKKIKQNIKKK
jgi:hypothetical protein